MGKLELKQKIIEETESFPIEVLTEVLDFVQFLKVKKSKHFSVDTFGKKLTDELYDLSQLSLTHLEEEFHNYQETYPYE